MRYILALFAVFSLITGCSKDLEIQNDVREQSKIKVITEFNKESAWMIEDFIDNVKNDISDRVIIISPSIEGGKVDPVINDLSFHKGDKKIKYSLDDSRVPLGNKEILTISCEELKKEDIKEEINYYLSNCDTNHGDKIQILGFEN